MDDVGFANQAVEHSLTFPSWLSQPRPGAKSANAGPTVPIDPELLCAKPGPVAAKTIASVSVGSDSRSNLIMIFPSGFHQL